MSAACTIIAGVLSIVIVVLVIAYTLMMALAELMDDKE